ncbi:hypothetical protein HYW74_01015 [Candidatus Pacearchaeota archaeon]|nr:hypothetical protein [Candidatus Pacearchaeota archaeon]
MDEKQKIKNLKDLEYNHILNKQNIALVLIGTAMIYTLFTEKLPQNLTRGYLLLFLLIMGIVFLWYFGRELNKIKEDITGL